MFTQSNTKRDRILAPGEVITTEPIYVDRNGDQVDETSPAVAAMKYGLDVIVPAADALRYGLRRETKTEARETKERTPAGLTVAQVETLTAEIESRGARIAELTEELAEYKGIAKREEELIAENERLTKELNTARETKVEDTGNAENKGTDPPTEANGGATPPANTAPAAPRGRTGSNR